MIKEIVLGQFKKHSLFRQKIEGKVVFIHGKNASGKTSILEGLSLFSPGSGIFNPDLDNLPTFGKTAFEIHLNANFKAKFTYVEGKKEIRINEDKKRQTDLLEFMRIYGLNPYITLAFWQDISLRRKQIDRLVMQNDPLYPSFCAKYAKTMKERNKLIELGKFNQGWEEIFNPILIENGLKITEIRTKVLSKIEKKINSCEKLRTFLTDDLKIIMSPNFEEQKAIFSAKMADNFIGPHKTKFDFLTQNCPAKLASTGQQKKILLTLTLSALPDGETTNILLLDDLFSTLDSENIDQILEILLEKNFQTWITHTQALPEKFGQNSQFQTIEL